MTEFGVCCFDDPNVCIGGWASLNGGEPQRVNGYAELSPQHYWVTNVNHTQYKKLNLYNLPHILDEQYFRSKFSLLVEEIGLANEPDKAAQALSKVFNNVMLWANKSFGDDLGDLSYRFSAAVSDLALPRFAREIPRGKHASALQDAFKQSTQINQGMSGVFRPKGSVRKAYSFPRANYAYTLLNQPYPADGNWKPMSAFKGSSTVVGIQDGVVVRSSKSTLEHLAEKGQSKAMLLKIHMESIERMHQSFASFGAGSSWLRNWVTLPEALELSRYSKFHIIEGFETSLAKLSILNELPPQEMGENLERSYSKALFLENVWTSLSKTLGNGQFFTSIGAYLRAYDRILCGRKAEKFAANNITVGSFSTGRIILFVTKSQERLANQIAIENSLIPPYIHSGG